MASRRDGGHGSGASLPVSIGPPEAREGTRISSIQVIGGFVEIWVDDFAATIAGYQNLALTVWHDRPKLHHAAQFDGVLGRLCSAHPKGIGSFVYIGPGTMPGDDAFRQALKEVLANHAQCLLGAAVVVEAEGFLSATYRGRMTTIGAEVPGLAAVRTFGELDAAVGWLKERLHARGGESPPISFVKEALATIHEYHASRAAWLSK